MTTGSASTVRVSWAEARLPFASVTVTPIVSVPATVGTQVSPVTLWLVHPVGRLENT